MANERVDRLGSTRDQGRDAALDALCDEAMARP